MMKPFFLPLVPEKKYLSRGRFSSETTWLDEKQITPTTKMDEQKTLESFLGSFFSLGTYLRSCESSNNLD